MCRRDTLAGEGYRKNGCREAPAAKTSGELGVEGEGAGRLGELAFAM